MRVEYSTRTVTSPSIRLASSKSVSAALVPPSVFSITIALNFTTACPVACRGAIHGARRAAASTRAVDRTLGQRAHAPAPARPDQHGGAPEVGGAVGGAGAQTGDLVAAADAAQPHHRAEMVAEFGARAVRLGARHEIAPAERAFIAQHAAQGAQRINFQPQ